MIVWAVAIAALAWGSFLNVVARRLLTNTSLLSPSHCPHCKKQLVWWQLIPLLSWFLLKGRCASCLSSISWLYPLGELLSAISITLLFLHFPLIQALCYVLFVSALLITIQTDLLELVIIRPFSVGLIPLGIIAAGLGLIPVSLPSSLMGAIVGYLILWFTGFGYRHVRRQEGLGEGDMELLAGIGAWTGWLGVWFTLTVAALLGVLIGPLIIIKRQSPQIPFGPLLAIAAFIFILLQYRVQAFLCL